MGVLGLAIDRLGTMARIVVGVIAIATVGVIIYIVMSAGPASYTPAFNGLSGRQAAEVQSALAGAGIPTKLGNGGASVLVPSSQVDAARVAAGAAGVGGQNADWSILDHMGLSMTQDQWKMAVLRARMGTLETQIQSLSGVNHATVNIAESPQSVFSMDQTPTTASVLLDTGGASLPDATVQGIVTLVAGAVPGLTSSHVTLTNERGQALNAISSSPIGAVAMNHMAAQDAWSSKQTAVAQSMLDKVLGIGNSTVAVSGLLNFDQTTIKQQQFGANKIALNGATEKEKLKSSGGAPTGAAGTAANIPGASALNGSAQSTYTHDKTQATNGVDVTQTDTVKAAGDPTRVSVALAVTNKSLENIVKGASVPGSPAQTQALASLQKTVAQAIGYDPTNKTNAFTVTPVASMPNPIAALKAAGLNVSTGGGSASGSALGGLIPAPFGDLLNPLGAGVGLLVMLFLVRKSLGRRQALLGSTDASWLPALEAPPIRIEDLMPALSGPSSAELAAVEKKALQGRVEEIAQSRPSDVAAQLRGWLAAES